MNNYTKQFTSKDIETTIWENWEKQNEKRLYLTRVNTFFKIKNEFIPLSDIKIYIDERTKIHKMKIRGKLVKCSNWFPFSMKIKWNEKIYTINNDEDTPSALNFILLFYTFCTKPSMFYDIHKKTVHNSNWQEAFARFPEHNKWGIKNYMANCSDFFKDFSSVLFSILDIDEEGYSDRVASQRSI